MKKRKIIGSKERPRLSVFRSLSHIYAQIIDDSDGKTLVSASSLKIKKGKKGEVAKKIGMEVAKAAISCGITSVVFDRGRCAYHGRIKALAEGAREGGLRF